MNAAKVIVEGDERFYGNCDDRCSMGTGVKDELTKKNFYTETPNNSHLPLLAIEGCGVFFSVA